MNTLRKVLFAACVGLALTACANAQSVAPHIDAAPAIDNIPLPGSDEVFIQAIDELGNPSHFCLDVPGFGDPAAGTGWHTEWPAGAHTCKTGIPNSHIAIVDQLMSRESLLSGAGQLRFTRIPVCIEIQQANNRGAAAYVRQDSVVLMAACSGSEYQRFSINAEGQIRPRLDETKCLTIGAESLEAGNRGPNDPWFRRDLSVSTCTAERATRQHWRIQTPPAG